MYSVGQERRLVDPPSQVVAGVRTVTTNMDGRDALPRMSRPFALSDIHLSCRDATNRARVSGNLRSSSSVGCVTTRQTHIGHRSLRFHCGSRVPAKPILKIGMTTSC